MSSAIGLPVGVMLGVFITRMLRHQTTTLLPAHGTLAPLLVGYVVRLIIICAVFSVLLTWSSTAALIALAGYWIGRSGYLVMVTRR